MPIRRLLSVVALAVLPLLVGSHAWAAAARPAQVKASLVAAVTAIQPGQAFTVALRLVHEPHWHTYWSNPGTGLPTSLDWKLPAGWTAGGIQWPAPMILKDSKANIVGNGYEGELLLPVTLTPPADLAPGSTVELKAVADWLMCADVCIPGSATVTLTLPVQAGAPPADPAYGEKIRATVAGLPRADPAWTVSAARSAQAVTLTVKPAAGVTHTPQKLHFFSDDGLIAYDLPQVVKPDGRGGFVVTLPVSPTGPASPPQLIGVLTSENGWLPGNTLRGLRVVTDFTAAAPGTGAGAPPPVGTTAGGGLPGTLLLAFLGGLILNLMPCVFPVLGIKILGFVNQAGQQRSKIVAHGLTFTLGVLISFWLLAGALAILRAGGEQLGWGFQLQSAGFVYALAVLLLVFGMNMSGVFEFGLGATAAVSNAPWMQQPKSGYTDSFFTGVLATAVATPCSAPFLAPALGAALAVPLLESFTIFTVIAVGLSTPYLLLSLFPQAVKVLPRPGAWMETFKQFMAFPLYATVGYLIWVLAAQTSEEGFRSLLFSLVLIAMAVWIYGRWNAPGASPGRARFGVIALVVVGALGLWLGWPREMQAQATRPGEIAPVAWEPWSPEAVAKLRAEGRTIYVDFTARWCATCQTNKKLVFGSDAVLKAFAEKKVATLRADWTNKDPRITAELAAYQRSAVPFNLIWKPGQEAPVILPELLTPGIVLDALP
ncbi:MAG: thioredoxin family protein [Opitutaceae bacterium]|nr:thioredoxin family protein [Opitutaceae bacterium]